MTRAALLLGTVLLLLPGLAGAQTLQQALSLAYGGNPALRSQRAAQRALDETAVQARTGWRPTLSVSLDAGYLEGPSSGAFARGAFAFNQAEGVLTATQPLYTGGRVADAVRAADTRVQAGQQGLRLAEAQTFQAVVTAYMDVLRDTDVLAVRRADLATLERQVRDTAARYALGASVTRTDVAQAQAQREQAAAALADARAQLDASCAGYRAAVGAAPGTLVQPERLPGLPDTLEQATALADAANPGLAQSRLAARASLDDVATARAAYRPTIGVQGTLGGIGAAVPFRGSQLDREATGLVTLTQPLVTGGLVASQVRQARSHAESDRDAAENAARQAAQSVEASWSRMRNGYDAIRADRLQVQAAELALRGYQVEYGYGLRSTLDVLIADQNLRAAEVALADAQHDTVVAEAALLAATGRLDARLLLPGQPLHDPQRNLVRVRRLGVVPWEDAVAALDQLGER